MGGKPIAVPDQFMGALMACADVAGIVSTVDETRRARFKGGETVEFKPDASLAGLLARVVQDDGDDRVRVLIEILGGKRETTVPARLLRKMA